MPFMVPRYVYGSCKRSSRDLSLMLPYKTRCNFPARSGLFCRKYSVVPISMSKPFIVSSSLAAPITIVIFPLGMPRFPFSCFSYLNRSMSMAFGIVVSITLCMRRLSRQRSASQLLTATKHKLGYNLYNLSFAAWTLVDRCAIPHVVHCPYHRLSCFTQLLDSA